jgi:photosystem II stability/assembly factor-like uncharacterized protein
LDIADKMVSVPIIDDNIVELAETFTASLAIAAGTSSWDIQEMTGTTLLDVHFTDVNTGWAVGSTGKIVNTIDGGVNWTAQISGRTDALWGVHFTDASNGWIASQGGIILNTSDGGVNWTVQNSGGGAALYGVYFRNATTGWAVGNSGAILHTIDGGATWAPRTVVGNTFQAFHNVQFTDAMNGWAVGNSGTIANSTDGGVTWNYQNSGTMSHFTDLSFTDVMNGWAVAQGGKIFKTTDGGANWAEQTSGTTELLAAVHFTDANNGWIAGGNGTIINTTDGGANWAVQDSSVPVGWTGILRGLHFTDAGNGWTVGNQGYIIKFTGGGTPLGARANDTTSAGVGTITDNDTATFTIDSVSVAEGGGTLDFTLSLSSPIDTAADVNVSFADVTTGAGDFTHTTQTISFGVLDIADKMVSVPIIDDNIVELAETFTASLAIAPGTPLVTRGNDTAGAGTGTITNDDTAIISFKTVPSEDELHMGQTSGFDFVIQIDKEIDVAVTIDVDTMNGEATLADIDYVQLNSTETFMAGTAAASNDQTTTVTVNGNHTDERNASNGNPDNESFLLRLSNIVAGGRDVIFASVDPGTGSWAPQTSGASAPTILWDVSFIDATTGWVVGGSGTILHTADGGANWAPQTSGTGSTLYGVHFTDASNGWAVGGTVIYHTADGGANWAPQTSGATQTLYGVHFTDANTGWAVGQGGTILHTSNGGATWAPQTVVGNTTRAFQEIQFTDANNGWAVGDHSTIANTTDGGATWNYQDAGAGGATVHFTALYFTDASNGWAVAHQGKIHHTSNGGATWTAQTSGTTQPLWGVHFTDANNGWAVGSGGTIRNTIDGGATWAAQTSGTTKHLRAVHFTDANNAWAPGEDGTILKFTGVLAPPSATLDGTGNIQNDDYDTVVAAGSSGSPSENSEDFDITLNVRVVNVIGASNPQVPVFAGALSVAEGATAFDVAKATLGNTSNVTFTDALGGALRNATLTGAFAANTEASGARRRFNGDTGAAMHVINNIPEFTLRTEAITVNGAATGYNGANIAVQSGPMPVVFTIANFIEAINADRGVTTGPPVNDEDAQTVRFTLNAAINAGSPMLFTVAGQPTVANSAGAGFTDQNLAFTVAPLAAGIATITISATDNGGPAGSGNGEQTTASQTFCISVYGTQPFAGDLAIADRGARVYDGSLMLVHTNAASATFPMQSIIDNTLVDAYELTIVTNSTALAGKSFLEYVVIDYETIVSAKGRGQQGLFGVNSVSQNRRTISTGQHFRVPLGVDLMPFEAGAATRGQFMVVDAEFEPALGKVILVHPATGNQTLLTQGGELFFPTGGSVAPAGSPDAGNIFVTDVGNVFGQTVEKNNNPRKIIRIAPDGTQTLLFSQMNDFRIPQTNGMITNLYHPTGIDVDPVSGDLYIADSFAKTIWKLPRTGALTYGPALVGVSVDADFQQPVHLAIAPNGGGASQFIYITDGATVSPGSLYAVATRMLHKLDLLSIDANGSANSTVFAMDGFLQEPRGIEIVPTDPLTGN